MPAPLVTLDEAAAIGHVVDASFAARCRGDVGIELEWLTFRSDDPADRPSFGEVQDIVADASRVAPRRSRLTIEPGGQLEISTRPARDAAGACRAAADDLFTLEAVCRRRGIELLALGADPLREPRRIVTDPRYRLMNHRFDQRGPEGRTMMCNTASLQLNVGLGEPTQAAARWRAVHQLGPALVAAFANSPLQLGTDTGCASSRLSGWWAIDPTRTRPVDGRGGEFADDPAARWARYVLDADVLFVRVAPNLCEPIGAGFTFADWMREGTVHGYPTIADLDEHLTTLFPPVRPRGWLEVRYLDVLPTPFWHVAVTVLSAVLDDPAARSDALFATEATGHRWEEAGRRGLADDALARAADEVFDIARDALARSNVDDATHNLVARYHDEYVRRRRCPADDRRDAFARTGELVPAAESPIRYAQMESAWR